MCGDKLYIPLLIVFSSFATLFCQPGQNLQCPTECFAGQTCYYIRDGNGPPRLGCITMEEAIAVHTARQGGPSGPGAPVSPQPSEVMPGMNTLGINQGPTSGLGMPGTQNFEQRFQQGIGLGGPIGLGGQMNPAGQMGLGGQFSTGSRMGLGGQLGPAGQMGLGGQMGPRGQLGLGGQMIPAAQLGLGGQMIPAGQLGLGGQMGPAGQFGLGGQLGMGQMGLGAPRGLGSMGVGQLGGGSMGFPQSGMRGGMPPNSGLGGMPLMPPVGFPGNQASPTGSAVGFPPGVRAPGLMPPQSPGILDPVTGQGVVLNPIGMQGDGAQTSGLMHAQNTRGSMQGGGSSGSGNFPGETNLIPSLGSSIPMSNPGAPVAPAPPERIGQTSNILEDETGRFYMFYPREESVGMRVDISKRGFCRRGIATRESNLCMNTCYSDKQCPRELKCCPNGCSLGCFRPNMTDSSQTRK